MIPGETFVTATPTGAPIVVLGAGPAGMACALALHTAGHPVTLLERYREARRRKHTITQVQQAYILGKVFHHTPAPLRPLRDLVLDHTPPLQKQVGERSPGEIIAQLDQMGDGIGQPQRR